MPQTIIISPTAVQPSPLDNRDFIAESIDTSNVTLPTMLDLRGEMLPVRHQGVQQSCAAFVSSAMKEWQERKDVGFQGYMSPQFMYDNRQNPNADGMTGRFVMTILSKKGCCPEVLYPYGQPKAVTDIAPELFKEAAKFVIQGYARVTTIDGLKKALFRNGPCMMNMPLYDQSSNIWKPKRPGQGMIGGHSMAVVGYNAEGFILRNSWGTGWGDKGHTIFPYADWGNQWDMWTTIDATSVPVDPSINIAPVIAPNTDANTSRNVTIAIGVIAALGIIAAVLSNF